jgi:penicillin-binding protein 2
MFHRRLRLVLICLLLGAAVLVLRAAQVQIVQRDRWADLATEEVERRSYFPAPRGRILDSLGRVLAEDRPTHDVVVDFRVVREPVDERWLAVRSRARARRLPEWPSTSRSQRPAVIEAERAKLLAQIESMWRVLADVSGRSRAEIDSIRRAVVDRVETRRQAVWTARFERALAEFEQQPRRSWLVRAIIGEAPPPTIEQFSEPIGDELASHAILLGVSMDVYNRLKLLEDELPGLSLRPAIRRTYPMGDVASHVIGHLGAVSREDLESDPHADDERLRYRSSDQIGRSGIERIHESALRGKRGAVVQTRSTDPADVTAAEPGHDVRLSIDAELQQDIAVAFERVEIANPDRSIETLPMTGAAVVIDVATNRVLAIVSVPGFDLNRFEEFYAQLMLDDLNRPMMNRATQDAVSPGSTVKPLVGIAGVAAGVVTSGERIECTGYPVFGGRRYDQPRCWTMSLRGVSHHKTPWAAPHPDGFLDLQDAVERSCNIYFEVVGDRLGWSGLGEWMSRFGLGRETGVGLDEAGGSIPRDAETTRSEKWYASIGQGATTATPIQLANLAATLARGGLWMTPVLSDATVQQRIDLRLPADAIAAVQRGMWSVVNSPAGTGDRMRRDDVILAAKTGSATVGPIRMARRDARGRLVPDDQGRPVYITVPFGSRANPNRDAPWYRASNAEGTRGTHGWAIGYAPADQPRIAFAVLVHYGGSGNVSAGSVVRQLIDACIEHSYLSPRPGFAPTNPSRPLSVPDGPTD